MFYPLNLLFPTHLSTLLPSLLYRPFCPTAFSFLPTFLLFYFIFPAYLSTLHFIFPTYISTFLLYLPCLPFYPSTVSSLPTFLTSNLLFLTYLSTLLLYLPYLLPSWGGGFGKIYYNKSYLHSLLVL